MSYVEKKYNAPKLSAHGPSHVFQDFETLEVRAWYGQDPYCLPEGPGVPIHCFLPPCTLNVPFVDYPNRPWVAYNYDTLGAHYYTSPTGQLFW